jgi:hypothetical protein
MKGIKQDNTPATWNRNPEIPREKLGSGTLKGRKAISLDSRTIIFVKNGHDVEEVVERYRARMSEFHWLDNSGNVNTK